MLIPDHVFFWHLANRRFPVTRWIRTAAEVDYLTRNEWAMTDEDILWRRSKLGLHMTEAERQHFAAALSTRSSACA